jgi:hypothetical protein
MNHQELLRWRNDAYIALSRRYSAQECRTILDWMHNAKSGDEHELVGDARYVAVVEAGILDDHNDFDLYNSLMWRIWYYAPFILKQAAPNNTFRQRIQNECSST